MVFKYDKYLVRLLDKNNKDELAEIQKLRYDYLLRDFNPELPPDGIDDDGYDKNADCIVVIDTENGKKVGTYRVASLETNLNKTFVDEEEFNIDSLKNCGANILELGRAVVHADYRNGIVIQLLWSAIYRYAIEHKCKYMFGTCSLHSTDPSKYANVFCYLKQNKVAEVEVFAKEPKFEFDFVNEYSEEKLKEEMPSLLRTYLSIGAKVSRNGFIDYSFNCCDVITVIEVAKINPLYARKFAKMSSLGND